MKIFCFDPMKKCNSYTGDYESSNHTFTKCASKNHYMLVERGYGIQEDVLQQLKKLGCKTIIIKTIDGLYVSSLLDWFKKSVKNYGHGSQRFLGAV